MMDKSPIYQSNYKPRFSGHESFQLRYGWLKKAYDAVVEDAAKNDTKSTFKSDEAMARFGVGKNMVPSMRHWAECCGIIVRTPKGSESSQPTDIAERLYDDNGLDPFMSHPASLWLHHWLMAGRPIATTWYWIFNHLSYTAFSRANLVDALDKLSKDRSWLIESEGPESDETIKRDVDCFMKTYIREKSSSNSSPEDPLRSPFHELGLIRKSGTSECYHFVRGLKPTLGQGVFMYALIDFWTQYAKSSKALSFEAIARAPGSPGKVFLLGEDDVRTRLLGLEEFTGGRFRWAKSESFMPVHCSAKRDLRKAIEFVERDYPSKNQSKTTSIRGDFDIDKALSETLQSMPVWDFESLKKYLELHPVRANRHYHTTGAMRWLDVHVVLTKSLAERVRSFKPDGDALGQLVFVIPEDGEADTKVLEMCAQAAASSIDGRSVVGLSGQALTIIDVARKLNALEIIKPKKDNSELAISTAKLEEIEERQGVLRAMLGEAVRMAIDDAKWCFGNGASTKLGILGLSDMVSDLADHLYYKAPHINTELLNRIKRTPPAQRGYRKLISVMVTGTRNARLGIENNYPVEFGMLSSLLKGKGLYLEDGSTWKFCRPTEEEDSARLFDLWEATSERLKRVTGGLVSIDDIYYIWSQKPFGVKRGVMPVLMVAYILSMRDNIEIHKNEASKLDLTKIYEDFIEADGRDFQLRWVEA